MLDLPRLQRIRLHPKPRVQRVIGWSVLFPNYRLPPRVTIRFENTERLPREPVVYAMNHTDRYNYWPFQYQLWRQFNRFTATWVKGKYYENRYLGLFMELTNNIPTVSRGYLITKDFLLTLGRAPTDSEYAALRRWVDAAATDPEAPQPEEPLPADLLKRARDPLGVAYRPSETTYAGYINALFARMMARFVELNQEAFDKGLDLLVFPEGTRSKRLSRGHVGLAQIALAYKKTIVPVGCSGSDKLYPGGNPLARGGRVTYRFGEPLRYEELQQFHVPERFVPFSADAEQRHHELFQGLVDLVMERINPLLDPEYQAAGDPSSQGVRGASRFV